MKIPLIFYGENEAEYGNPIADMSNAQRSWDFFSSSGEDNIFLGGNNLSELRELGLKPVDWQPYMPINPEILKEKNVKYKVGKFSFMANSRAKAINEAEGFVKILADEMSDKVLGVHLIGPHAGELIAEMAVAMEFGASAEDIARTCHAHPTFSEAIKEAALSVDKRAIHS